MDKLTNNDAPIMGNCLSCQGLVRVPATAPTSSKVKCPHCGEEFQLSQILNHAVPELQIVEDETSHHEEEDEGAVKDADGRFVVANQLRQSSKKSRRSKRRRRSRRPEETEGMVPVPKPLTEDLDLDASDSESSQFAVSERQSSQSRESFDSRRASGSGSGSGTRRSSSDSSRRSSSRSSSGGGGNVAVEIMKVVFGGALAIPIAYLLVLWVFKQDPLHVAPKIVQTAPFLIPAEFRPPEEEQKSATDEDSEDPQESEGGDLKESDRALVEEILDVSSGLPKPRRDPGRVGVN